MIELVISGGQTGADQAGWRAAKRFGIATGGWMPAGFLTEDGLRPEFAEIYGAKAILGGTYRDRTVANIEMADRTFLFGDPRSPGGRLCVHEAIRLRRPITVIGDPDNMTPAVVAAHIGPLRAIRVLNVAGNRESKAPGIGEWVESYLIEFFGLVEDDR